MITHPKVSNKCKSYGWYNIKVTEIRQCFARYFYWIVNWKPVFKQVSLQDVGSMASIIFIYLFQVTEINPYRGFVDIFPWLHIETLFWQIMSQQNEGIIVRNMYK